MLDNDTFNKWASYHESCFRGFIPFLAETPDRQEIWRRALNGYTTDELKHASYEMYTAREKPPGYSSHLEPLLDVLRASRESSRVERENATRYAHICGLCGNRGLVDVVAKLGCEFPDQHGGRFARERVLSVACKCSAGDRFRSHEASTRDGKRTVGFATFDATRMETHAAHRSRERVLTDEMREAGKTLRGTIAFCKRELSKMGEMKPVTQEPAR